MRTVLIVEDSEACAETLQIALEALPDVRTVVVRSPAAALVRLRRDDAEISAVVTDLHMPKSDGFDLIRQLRKEARYAKLPILMISGDSDPRLPQRALESGADAFFSKPYSPAAVRRKLEQLLC
jgi:CheY-like chemotaxis protein